MVDGVAIRPAVPGDAAACAAILNAWIDATDWMPRCHAPEDVERHCREFVLVEREVAVAERVGQVVGYSAVDVARSYVTALYVDAKARGSGIGKSLMDLAKANAPGVLNLWTFVANTHAQRFYQREGFQEAGRSDGDNEEGLPDILYRWEAGA